MMKFSSNYSRLTLCVMALCVMALCAAKFSHAQTRNVPVKSASFADFDARAKSGARLNVVFFGASLTWGANASDSNLTSYRALIGQRLEKKYPRAHFAFWDAAIGGTTSQLGAFRFERDVLRHKPDLVFLDFSANDDIGSADAEKLASYEALMRRVILEAKCPLVQVIFPFKWNVQYGKLEGMQRRTAHLKLARAYNSAVGDAIALARARVEDGSTSLDKLWPFDGAHPGDSGYALFADAAWSALENAVREKQVCRAPQKMIYAPTYLKVARFHLSQLESLPAGWSRSTPLRTAAYFDMLTSRWLDDVAVASNRIETKDADGKGVLTPIAVKPLRLSFEGSTVLLLGESTKTSAKFRVALDDKIIEHTPWGASTPINFYDAGEFATKLGNNAYLVQVLIEGLDATKTHTLEIAPLFADESQQELRIESVCVAGGAARVIAEGEAE